MPPKDKTFDLALELHRAGRHDEAMRTCRKLLRRKPTHHRALGLFAHAALETGQLAQAREAAERLATLRPDDVAGWNLRGRVALLEGDAETAHAVQ
ncbi:MAG: tetratricopeptide repeat protein, partial [Gammaproteobacteria bacterium]|nr:tetratricopeptide repeat protein [Gammaproteobacteria bacterium]